MTDAGRLEEIRARCEAAIDGPWEHYHERVPLNAKGLEEFPDKPDLTRDVHWVRTVWHDGMLQAPYPIVTVAVSPFFDPHVTIHCRPEEAEFIAHAREDIPWLLARVAELEAALLDIDDTAKAWQRQWCEPSTFQLKNALQRIADQVGDALGARGGGGGGA